MKCFHRVFFFSTLYHFCCFSAVFIFLWKKEQSFISFNSEHWRCLCCVDEKQKFSVHRAGSVKDTFSICHVPSSALCRNYPKKRRIFAIDIPRVSCCHVTSIYHAISFYFFIKFLLCFSSSSSFRFSHWYPQQRPEICIFCRFVVVVHAVLLFVFFLIQKILLCYSLKKRKFVPLWCAKFWLLFRAFSWRFCVHLNGF